MNDRSKDPLKEFVETNCYGTLNLANQASKTVKAFVFKLSQSKWRKV